MICKFCNVEIEDGSTVCPVCGKSLAEETPVAPAVHPENVKTAESKALTSLILAIVGMALSFIIPPVGIILSVIALRINKKAKDIYGVRFGITAGAFVLAIFALVYSIIATLAVVATLIPVFMFGGLVVFSTIMQIIGGFLQTIAQVFAIIA